MSTDNDPPGRPRPAARPGAGRGGRRLRRRAGPSGAFIGGPDVGAFEQEYAAFVGAAHCVGVANGTDALELALRARRRRRRRRGRRAGQHLHRHRRGGRRAPGPTSGLVDCDAERRADRRRAGARGRSAPDTGAVHAGRPVRPGGAVRGVRGGCSTARGGRGRRPVPGRARATAERPARSGTPRAPASTPARTSAPTATPARSSPTTPSDRRGRAGARRPRRDRRSTSTACVGVNSRLDTMQAVVLRAKLRRLAGLERAAPSRRRPLRRAARPTSSR